MIIQFILTAVKYAIVINYRILLGYLVYMISRIYIKIIIISTLFKNRYDDSEKKITS